MQVYRILLNLIRYLVIDISIDKDRVIFILVDGLKVYPGIIKSLFRFEKISLNIFPDFLFLLTVYYNIYIPKLEQR